MTSAEQVTKFVIRTDEYETPLGTFSYRSEAVKALASNDLGEDSIKHVVTMSEVKDLTRALNTHLKEHGLEPDEYGFSVSSVFKYENKEITIPQKYRWLIAFAIEGSNEGYYVHVGALMTEGGNSRDYIDLALAKTYSPENAYQLATEAQRFLTAAQWN